MSVSSHKHEHFEFNILGVNVCISSYQIMPLQTKHFTRRLCAWPTATSMTGLSGMHFHRGLLFLGTGAVIHAVADNQEFR